MTAALTVPALAKREFVAEADDFRYLTEGRQARGKRFFLERGDAAVRNPLGSCQGCHLRVAAGHDSVCELVVGLEGLGLTEQQEQVQVLPRDARCQ